MTDKLLVVSNRESDFILLEDLLVSRGFTLQNTPSLDTAEAGIQKNIYSAMIVDLDYVNSKVFQWLNLLQENRSGLFLIAYGDNTPADLVSELLRKGVFGFISRSLLSDRIVNTVDEGLNNRSMFLEIMKIMDQLVATNNKLVQEREALKSRNAALTFLHNLSTEIAYDLNWHNIIPRMIDAGLSRIIDANAITMLYRMGARWHLDLYLPGESVREGVGTTFKKEILERFFSMSHINHTEEEIIIHFFPANTESEKIGVPLLSGHLMFLLKSAESPLGLFTLQPKGGETIDPLKKELLSTTATILSMSLKNAKEYRNLKEMTTRDELTGLMNRKGFEDYFYREFQKTRRFEKPLSLIMLDIDNLKAINDTLGHQAGDHMLKEFAKCLINPLRKTDMVCRFDGDKFAVILPETEIEKAEILIKRLLTAIRSHPFIWQSKPMKVQVNFGISATNEPARIENEDDLILRANDRCYRSKRSENNLYSLAI